ncbi:MAG: leucine-rich repeat protein [Clostridiales bacterium]|nr:leucine-rich repeat protein [Clostridiales bacterium]
MIVMIVGILPVQHAVFADTDYTPFRFTFDAEMIRKENVFMIYSDTVSITDKDNNAPKDTSGISLYFDGALYTDIDCKTKLDHIPHQPEPFYVHAIVAVDTQKSGRWGTSGFHYDRCYLSIPGFDGRCDEIKFDEYKDFHVQYFQFTFRVLLNKPLFTTQPKGATIKTGESHHVTWETNFAPDLLERYKDGKLDKTFENPEIRSDDIKVAGTYKYRAWYYSASNAFIDSAAFEVKNPDLIYTVTFNPGKGSVTPKSVKTEKDGKLKSIPTPTRDGYTFQGWYTPSGYKVTSDTVFTENTTVTASWEGNLSGSVSYTGSAVVGKELGTVCKLNPADIPADKIKYQWQANDNDSENGWKYIFGANEATYVPTTYEVLKYIRVIVKAEGYKGTVEGAPVFVDKQTNSSAPVAPALAISSPYTEVTITNAKADQEYAVSYAFNTAPDWSKATHPSADGSFKIAANKDCSVYVHTRMRETETQYAGTKTEYTKIYNGYVSSLADLVLDKTSVTTTVGSVTKLTVKPLPSDFSGWNDEYKVTWGVNGSGVVLFTNSACTIPVETSIPVSYKTVYAKATKITSYAQVVVEKQVGYNDIRVDFCRFEVVHKLTHVEAKASSCTEAGHSAYYICKDENCGCNKVFSDKDGKNEISIEDTVIPAGHKMRKHDFQDATCTENGHNECWYCTGCKTYFKDPEGTTSLTPAEIFIAAKGHDIKHVDAEAATCTKDGHEEYYECKTCHKKFSDDQGTTEKTEISVTPKLGHDWDDGTVTKEPTCEKAGVRTYHCKRDGCTGEKEEAIDPLGHDKDHLEHHPAKAATRDNDGHKEYYTCPREGCGQMFADPEGNKKVTVVELIIPKIGAAVLGEKATVGDFEYQVTNPATDGTGTVTLTGVANKTASVSIPLTVEIKETVYKVNRIGPKAFYGNKTITSLSIGANVAIIDANAFYGCSNLTKVSGGKGLKTIGNSAFAKCSKLKSFSIASPVLSKIGTYAFNKDKKLKTLNIKYTTALTKAGVKKSLKGSKVKTVKVKKSKVKKYKKFFKKKNSGRTVKVKK